MLILVGCIMAVILAVYIVIVPIYLYNSVQKSMHCKYALESAKREHKSAFWQGLALLVVSTVVFLFVAIVVETVSR